ncbi:MAG: orotate phosphoribosyltransferase [Microgenomates group bacterium]
MQTANDYWKNDLVNRLISIEAVKIRPLTPFTYTSGNKGPIYFDLRLLMGYPQDRDIVTLYYLDMIDRHVGLENIDVVSGTATAGIPLAAWVVEKLRKPMVYVRGKQKDYGLQKTVEGVLKEGQRVLIVEDIVNFGTSSLGNVASLREQKAKVVGCISIVDYEQKEAHAGFKKEIVPLFPMVTVREVVTIAHELKAISNEEYSTTSDWLENPLGWWERMNKK